MPLPELNTDTCILVSIARQQLTLFEHGESVMCCSISTAANGAGELNGSEKTPRGWHRVRARIGGGCPQGTVFRGRRPTGEVYSEPLARQYPQRDWILTRILWLSGSEPGRNRLGNVDSMRRYIYIHGCPDSEPMGEPRSHGCIRMRNSELVQLYDRVPVGMPVLIEE